MSEKVIFTIGESVVNTNSYRTGKIMDATATDSGDTESVQIQYDSDGTVEWVFVDKVAKMLLETDPKPNTNNLNENWPV